MACNRAGFFVSAFFDFAVPLFYRILRRRLAHFAYVLIRLTAM